MRWPFAAAKRSQELQATEIGLSPSTKFAFKLFRELTAERESQNVFISPASVFFCLWLLREGATGVTQSAMNETLEVNGLTPETLHRTITNLKSALQIQSPDLILEVANSLWCNPQWAPRREYVETIRNDYDADIFVLEPQRAEAIARINAWVAEKTHDKIDSIVNDLDPLISALVLNAIYFKALWRRPFLREDTVEDFFHTSDGRKLRIPLMDQYGAYPYYEERSFQAVRLGYMTSRLAMYVFLPSKKSKLREFHQQLTCDAWDNWMRRFERIDGHIRFPRFKLTYDAGLRGILARLGMEIAFDPSRARFDVIKPPPPGIYVDDVIHRAFLDVNEEGTEAAAVTGTMLCLSAMDPSPPPRTFEMIVDRPFFLAICDDLTKSLLFMCSVEEPHG